MSISVCEWTMYPVGSLCFAGFLVMICLWDIVLAYICPVDLEHPVRKGNRLPYEKLSASDDAFINI